MKINLKLFLIKMLEPHKIKTPNIISQIKDYAMYGVGKKEVKIKANYKKGVDLMPPLIKIGLARIKNKNKLHIYYIIKDSKDMVGIYPKHWFVDI